MKDSGMYSIVMVVLFCVLSVHCESGTPWGSIENLGDGIVPSNTTIRGACGATLGYTITPDTMYDCAKGGKKGDKICYDWATGQGLSDPKFYTCENMNLSSKKCIVRCDQKKPKQYCESMTGSQCNEEDKSQVPSRPNACECT